MAARPRGASRLIAILCAAGLAACASKVEVNVPLAQSALNPTGYSISSGGYRWGDVASKTDPEMIVIVAFSGGGKRSSAFGYGILKGLRDTTVATDKGTRSLLSEVDYISAVSGGSFPAAYYGLYRDKIFTDFEKDFLKRDIDSYIYGTFLLPWNFRWLFDESYGTNDRMAAIYDDLMFRGATFAALEQNGRPFVSIDATDVDYGLTFPFTQDYFDLLCSDLKPFPIARAVAASNGFPVLFTPITLKSYREQCGGRVPPWVAQAAEDDPLSRQYAIARTAKLYLDPRQTDYVHLLDGGIADNLAMRGLINAMLILNTNPDVLKRMNALGTRRILLISADGQAAADTSGARQATISGIGRILSVVSGVQIDAYNFETMRLAREQIDELADALKHARCARAPVIDGHACDDVSATFVHLSLADVQDPATRERLQKIPTGLTVPDDDVDALVAAGEAAVLQSPEIQAFRADVAQMRAGASVASAR